MLCCAEWLPRKAENLTPYTMALIAKYVARHRLREPRLLDTIANFLLKRGEQLDSKVGAAARPDGLPRCRGERVLLHHRMRPRA